MECNVIQRIESVQVQWGSANDKKAEWDFNDLFSINMLNIEVRAALIKNDCSAVVLAAR